ncbi:hypothetical protein FRC02_002630 [Tulasnella sp. 418]|nr:hypothetical protein FRC02_002630 [Tulasnella sp. 418]
MFKFGEEFPAAPPKCWFVTRIFHPNVSKSGEICVNTLKKDWKREYGIAHILVTIKCLLIYPNPESALDEAAGKLLLEKYEDYCKHAKLMTSVHATPKTRPPEFDTPSVIPDSQPSASTSSASSSSTSTTLAAPSSQASGVRHNSPAPAISPRSNDQNSGSALGHTTESVKPASKTSSTPAALSVAVEPLQPSVSVPNVSRTVMDTSPLKASSGVLKTSPTPVATTTSTIPPKVGTAIGGGGTAAVKRSNGATGGGAEKRKKGLKRL